MLRSVFFRYRPAIQSRFLSAQPDKPVSLINQLHVQSQREPIKHYQEKYPKAVEKVIHDFFSNLENTPISNEEQEDLAIKNARLQREYGVQVTITNVMDHNNPKAFVRRSLSLQVVEPNIASITRFTT